MIEVGNLDDRPLRVPCRHLQAPGRLDITETDTSARVAVHVAVATRADMLLARPGMGVDEGVMIVANEQSRLLARIARRGG